MQDQIGMYVIVCMPMWSNAALEYANLLDEPIRPTIFYRPHGPAYQDVTFACARDGKNNIREPTSIPYEGCTVLPPMKALAQRGFEIGRYMDSAGFDSQHTESVESDELIYLHLQVPRQGVHHFDRLSSYLALLCPYIYIYTNTTGCRQGGLGACQCPQSGVWG